ncbi:ATPase [Defluviimonas sp. 20V17]|uniref:Glucosamine kinase n=1 Tax=Allgaiera indica TaxID=765699 RepID=A0AAN4ZXY5_9RHOB|nr:BadF/BadG/BcrA/BcrD ATPase family protein [Allgaiera indica]KDB03642.1 ATPase [Defluviimonas sp. 20V17]GHD98226.1 N-acetylglucosamine kinase [Allgaiera indica]SDW51255.1 glucosamine kinase [Allgaiera indica]
MPFYVGVDGGGSGCRAAVSENSGRIVGRGQSGPANIVTDPDGARANIVRAVEQAIAGTGATLRSLHAVLGIAGANLPEYSARLSDALPFATTRIESDALIALKGAIGDDDGVVATLGTGSAFTGQICGQVKTIGGWGLALGDEASGAWLGRALLARALLAVDGLAQMTPLLESVIDDHGRPEELVALARKATPSVFGAYAPRLLEAEDDPAASTILGLADRWITRCIELLAPAGDTPVTFVGGLGPHFARRLAGRFGNRIREPRGSALDGALWMARQAEAA